TALDFTTSVPDPAVLQSSSPTDGAVDVAITTVVTLSFDKAMARGPGAISLYNETDAVALAAPSVAVVNTTATITPAADLPNDKLISVRVAADALAGADGGTYPGLTGTDLSFTTEAIVLPLDAPDTGGTSTLTDGVVAFNALTNVTGGEPPYAVTDVITPGSIAAQNDTQTLVPGAQGAQPFTLTGGSGPVSVTGVSA
ncbi:MAG: Ig-like domain-containing protein, partial [Pseudomonadota bacterium]